MRHRLSNFLLAAAIACAPLASHAFETANGKRIRSSAASRPCR